MPTDRLRSPVHDKRRLPSAIRIAPDVVCAWQRHNAARALATATAKRLALQAGEDVRLTAATRARASPMRRSRESPQSRTPPPATARKSQNARKKARSASGRTQSARLALTGSAQGHEKHCRPCKHW
eukprot:1752825-Pleurochrysis_carterae.AAC.2